MIQMTKLSEELFFFNTYQYFIGFGNKYKYIYESHLRMLVLLVIFQNFQNSTQEIYTHNYVCRLKIKHVKFSLR